MAFYINSFYSKEEVKKEMKYNYVLWIGGVDDYFVDLDQAHQNFWEWIDKGYEDVILQDLKTNKILKRG